MNRQKAVMMTLWIVLLLAVAWFAVEGPEEQAAPQVPQAAQATETEAPVKMQPYRKIVVRDGDSLELDGKRIRLWAIDAPEYRQDCKQGNVRRFCGEEAHAMLKKLIGNGTPQCRQRDIDQYDRVVAQCFVDGKDLGEQMVLAGWALAYMQHGGAVYTKAQDEAMKDGRGLWAMNFTKPWVWRQRQRAAENR